MSREPVRLWGAIPAAGVGRRMGGTLPKQYLELCGRRVIEHSIAALRDHPRIAAVYVALAEEDRWWPETRYAEDPAVRRVAGGAERVESVRNLLYAVQQVAAPDDWVLVHDAARPGLTRSELDRLITACVDDPVGGLLGVPVRDTLKRVAADGRVAQTTSREGVWHALTPQMFRLAPLLAAIEQGVARGLALTDEASAMEAAGLHPLLVAGSAANLKITHPDDLLLIDLCRTLSRKAEPTV